MTKLKIKHMKRRIYKSGVLPSEIRHTFGDMRYRKTWENAYQHYFPSQHSTITTDDSSTQPVDRPVEQIPTPQNECNLVKMFLQERPEKVTRRGIYQVPPKTATAQSDRNELSAQADTKGVVSKFLDHKIRDSNEQPKYETNEKGESFLFNINVYTDNSVRPKKRRGRKTYFKPGYKGEQLVLFSNDSIEVVVRKNSSNETHDSFTEDFPEVAAMFRQWATI